MMQTDKEYATALFLLAAEENRCDDYYTDLLTVRQVLEENPVYVEFLASPAISLEERLRAIDAAFASLSEHIVSFLKLLCEAGRARLITDCIDEYGLLLKALSGKTAATVRSAVPLSDEQKAALCAKLEAMTNKQIEPLYVIDESLIGGVCIDVEGKTFDGSIRGRLRDVKDVMMR